MTFNVNSFDKFFETLETKDSSIRLMHSSDYPGYRLSLVVSQNLDYMKTLKNGPEAVIDSIAALKQTILSNRLFDSERIMLEKYEKLKDMKFVLEEINKLDIVAINKIKYPEDQLSIL